jgi:hypothetical protein
MEDRQLKDRVFSLMNATGQGKPMGTDLAAPDKQFETLALDVFRFQFDMNPVYRAFCLALNRPPAAVHTIWDIPFLPVAFYKYHKVISFEGEAEQVFLSSGTTAQQGAYGLSSESSTPETPNFRSRHFVKDMAVYEQSFLSGFRHFYGDPGKYVVLALLPSYLERDGSSLVYMAQGLIEQSGHPESGFYLNDLDRLVRTLTKLMHEQQGRNDRNILLLGVSFALLDLAENHPMKMKNTIVMETGGMKGRRKEPTRDELHGTLKAAFGLDVIHSEYGMTELLSQAYSGGDGLFACPPWMRVLIRDSNDPLQITDGRRAGGVNVIDLANIHSCSFVATQDLGKIHPGGMFEILGRFDNSDVRGCNLMVGF